MPPLAIRVEEPPEASTEPAINLASADSEAVVEAANVVPAPSLEAADSKPAANGADLAEVARVAEPVGRIAAVVADRVAAEDREAVADTVLLTVRHRSAKTA